MNNTLFKIIAAITLTSCSIFAETANTPDQLTTLKEKNTFELSITSNGLKVGGETISRRELETTLADLADNTAILIRAESTTLHKEVVSVMELCSKAGLNNVTLATTKEKQDRDISD